MSVVANWVSMNAKVTVEDQGYAPALDDDIMHWKGGEAGILYHKRVAVLGGGHAARGLAGYLSLHGFDISMFNRTIENVQGIIDNGGLEVHGVIKGHASIPLVTDDMASAIHDRQLLIVTVPAQAHQYYARKMAPHLKPGQLVLLMPGRTGGALEFFNLIRRHSSVKKILLGEAQTFSFVSRATGPRSVLISKLKNIVKVSAFPSLGNQRFISHLKRLPFSLELADDVIETSLNNIGAMLHPAPTILCAGLLESRGGGYNHYHEAISKTVGRLIVRMDRERTIVARSYSANPMSLIEWLRDTYGAEGTTLCECIRNTDAYDGIGSPSTLEHRYVLEDIPTGLVPISSFGRLAGVKTPAIDAVVNMACQLYECNFWRKGRDLTSLGLTGMSIQEVIEYVRTGIRPVEYARFPEVWEIPAVEVKER